MNATLGSPLESGMLALALARTLGFTISMVAGDGTARQMVRTLATTRASD